MDGAEAWATATPHPPAKHTYASCSPPHHCGQQVAAQALPEAQAVAAEQRGAAQPLARRGETGPAPRVARRPHVQVLAGNGHHHAEGQRVSLLVNADALCVGCVSRLHEVGGGACPRCPFLGADVEQPRKVGRYQCPRPLRQLCFHGSLCFSVRLRRSLSVIDLFHNHLLTELSTLILQISISQRYVFIGK